MSTISDDTQAIPQHLNAPQDKPSATANGAYMHTDPALLRAAARGVTLLVRQSTAFQKDNNVGSYEYQLAQREQVSRFGLDPLQVGVVDLRGEQASDPNKRPKFNRLLDDVKANRVGVLVMARQDRLARNDRDTAAVLELLREQKGFVLIDGQLYDPTSAQDELVLGINGVIARHDQRQRTNLLIESRLGLAKKLNYRRPLPTGLIWASPTDPHYRHCAEKAGLTDRLAQASAQGAIGPDGAFRAVSALLGQLYVPLPYPDAAVVRSVELRLRWFEETGSVSAVLRRIVNGEGDWPAAHRGRVPRTTARVFKQDTTVEWVDAGRVALAAWLQTPALFGIYSHVPERTGRERKRQDDGSPVSANTRSIFQPDAFPAFAGVDDYYRTRAALTRQPRTKTVTVPEGPPPTNHVLPLVRCAHVLDEEHICGHRLAPVRFNRAGDYRYTCGECSTGGHPMNIAAGPIERLVVNTLTELFQEDVLRSAMQALRLDVSHVTRAATALRKELADLRPRLHAASESEDDARLERNPAALADAKARQQRYRIRIAELEGALERQATNEARLQDLAQPTLGECSPWGRI